MEIYFPGARVKGHICWESYHAGSIAYITIYGRAKRSMVRVINPPAIGDKEEVTKGSLGKAGGYSLPVTLEGRVALGGSFTPTPTPHSLLPAPQVAPSAMTSF